jgi:hypothetical protein
VGWGFWRGGADTAVPDLWASAVAAEKMDAVQLIEMAKANHPGLRGAIAETLDAKELKEGAAWIARGPEFFFAMEVTAKPELFMDGAAALPNRLGSVKSGANKKPGGGWPPGAVQFKFPEMLRGNYFWSFLLFFSLSLWISLLVLFCSLLTCFFSAGVSLPPLASRSDLTC